MRLNLTAMLTCLALAAMALSSCDEGRLYEGETDSSRDGRIVKVTGTWRGATQWADGYSVAIAGFSDSEYADISKNLQDGSTVLSGIDDEVETVEVCVINRLRKRIATFATLSIADAKANDTVRWELGELNTSMFEALQQKVFNTTCANCHGGSNFAAANLYLTQGKSYASLVDVDSELFPEMKRVLPGSAEGSLMYQILSTDASSSWAYDHSVEVVDESTLQLIASWIDNGALE